MKELCIGKGECMKEGNDLAILSIGPIGLLAQEVAKAYEASQGSIALYNMRFVKPLDSALLHQIGKKFKKIITIENGVVQGEFGSAVLEFFSENGYTPKVKRLGLPDAFVEHGSVQELHQLCGLDAVSIKRCIDNMLMD